MSDFEKSNFMGIKCDFGKRKRHDDYAYDQTAKARMEEESIRKGDISSICAMYAKKTAFNLFYDVIRLKQQLPKV